ncbi:FAD-dependent oxidoreductase [Hymenobacter sp. DG25B]|uniref:FAD-dependent oxidoreductase n=1 Tax=Hymenobacter sp. DG25B TaxID=1385664 RepID=UPI00066252A7|nr:NAD(P)/FAD-dependent oxidoreductase [Hymenobacter sp. DG25B]
MAHFLIIGAGIGGLATAHGLLQQGHTVQVIEAAPELREIGAGVVLGANAMQALSKLGLQETIQAHGTPITKIQLRDEQGGVLQTVDTSEFTRQLGFPNLGIHRAALQKALLQGLPPMPCSWAFRLSGLSKPPPVCGRTWPTAPPLPPMP